MFPIIHKLKNKIILKEILSKMIPLYDYLDYYFLNNKKQFFKNLKDVKSSSKFAIYLNLSKIFLFSKIG